MSLKIGLEINVGQILKGWVCFKDRCETDKKSYFQLEITHAMIT